MMNPANPYPAEAMSVREWYAGQALAGLMADPKCCPEEDETRAEWLTAMARLAFALADAMIAASQVTQPKEST